MRVASRIAFVHPDLGIGGAERLVVDAALSLQDAGHRVSIYTSHHDPARCFPETRDGTLEVRVYGNFIPSHLGNHLRAPLAIAGMAYASAALAGQAGDVDLIFCDLVPHVIPLLRLLSRAPVLYYCHFPDLLHAAPRRGLYGLYRRPIDWAEGVATGMASRVLVNSEFTASAFRRTFSGLQQMPLDVVHPGVDTALYDGIPTEVEDEGTITVLSVNRFERKKGHDLAISAFAQLRGRLPDEVFSRLRLVILGGFDDRVAENRVTFAGLQTQARDNGVHDLTEFVRSCPDAERLQWLARSRCVLYTPSDEHFGYVPIEAMAAGRPVVAVDRGGPRETVVHDVTGFLCAPSAEAFASAIARLVTEPGTAERMGRAGREHVRANFSRPAFAQRLLGIVDEMTSSAS